MNFLQQIYPGDSLASFIIRVLAEITMITVVSILATRTFGRKNPAMQHGICICALLCVMAAPLTTLGLQKLGWSTFQISLESEKPRVLMSPATVMGAVISAPVPEPTPFWTLERARGTASLVILIWIAGTAVLLGRLTIGAKKVKRLRASARPVEDSRLESVMDSLTTVEGLPSVPVRYSSRVHSPVVIGPRRSMVILPERLLERLDERQLRSILAHELTHVRQRDPFFGLIQRLVEASYWPHPLVHVLNRDLVRAREEVCDNVALHGVTAPQYADTLLTIALGGSSRRTIPGVIGLMTRPWRLEERVQGLLDPHRRLTTTMNTRHLALMGIALATGMAVIAGADIVAAPYPPNAQDTLDLYSHVDQKTGKVTMTQTLKRQAKSKKAVKGLVRVQWAPVAVKTEDAAHWDTKAGTNDPTVLEFTGQRPPTSSQPGTIKTIKIDSPAVSFRPPFAIVDGQVVSPKALDKQPVVIGSDAQVRAITQDVDPVLDYTVTDNGRTITIHSKHTDAHREDFDVVRANPVIVDGAKTYVTRDLRAKGETSINAYTIQGRLETGNLGKGETYRIETNPKDTVVIDSATRVEQKGQVLTFTGESGKTFTFTIPTEQVKGADQEPVVVKWADAKAIELVRKHQYPKPQDPTILRILSEDKNDVKYLDITPQITLSNPEYKAHTPELRYLAPDVKVYSSQIKTLNPTYKTFTYKVDTKTKNFLTPSYQSYVYKVTPKVQSNETTVYVDGGHVKVVGDHIKVVYVHSKKVKKPTKNQ